MSRWRRPRSLGVLCGAVVLALTVSGCSTTTVPGIALPAAPPPSIPDVTSLPELPELADTPTWDEFNTTITEVVDKGKQAGTITDTSYLDSLVDALKDTDHDDPVIRAILRTIQRQVVNQGGNPTVIDVPSQKAGTALTWSDCGPDGLQCASLEVPMDYDQPDGKTSQVKLDRYQATDPAKRKGVLLSNPGGPGGSGVDFLPSWYTSLSDEVKAAYDVVSFDPRGVGQSEGIQCGPPPEPYSNEVVANPTTPDEEAAYAAEADKLGQACANTNGPFLGEVGSRDVARDMDEMRKAMGEEQLSYVGYSYGTAIGQAYATMFPDRVGAFVLDGIVDTGLTKQGISSVQTKAFDNSLRRFAKSCPKVCPGLAEYLMQRSGQGKLPAKYLDQDVGQDDVAQVVTQTLYKAENWPLLAVAMRTAAKDNDATLLGLLADGAAGRSVFDGEYSDADTGDFSYYAVMCHDFATQPLDKAFEISRADNRLHPVFTNGPDVLCNEWGAKADPLGPLVWPEGTNVLLVSTTGDPATPHSMGKAVAARNPGSTLLTHNGDGHTVYTDGDSCVDTKVDDFLLTGKQPPKGTVCD